MAVSEIGNSNRVGTDYSGYKQSENEVLFKTYSYQNGKGQEKVYYAKDCVELSLNSFTIPFDSDNYEEIKNMLKKQSGSPIANLGNRMFYETYEVMEDYYSGKLSSDEVKDIFREYFYHCAGKTSVTESLAGLYEYFSRANTRNACEQNMREGKELMESNGLKWSGTYYYNADWYYACEEMQELFRETANELADEYGAEHVDFQYVEQNTKFALDGGITFNGVWDSREWQINYDRAIGGSFLDNNMAPPKGFVYCSTNYWNGEKIPERIKENETYKSAVSFLKNFNINWNFRGNRLEFLGNYTVNA